MEFKLTARLGRGATVETFTGTLVQGGTAVVVKRPRPELREHRSFSEALVSWGRAQRSLHHANLVDALSAGTADDGAYVVQERVNGASLARILAEIAKRSRTFRPDLAFSIALQAAEATAFLHSSGVVHGGIDPSEVLIGYGGEVKLGDQALHTLDRVAGGDHGQEATYLAPEIAAGRATASTAGDVYSLALVMLEMLIGHPVWAKPSMTVEASVKALHDFSHVGLAQPALTDDLVTVLGFCLEREVESRLPTANEVRAEFLRIARKNHLAPDPAALGAFVRALIPQPRADEAPTMLVQTGMAYEDVERRREFREASVLIDARLLEKALGRAESMASGERFDVGGGDETTERGRAQKAAQKARPAAKPQPQDRAAEEGLLDRLPGGERGAWTIFAGLIVLAVVLLALLLGRSRGG